MKQRYRVEGMDCAHCALTVEKGVRRLPGVRGADVNFATGMLELDGAVDEAALRERVESLGYGLGDARDARVLAPEAHGRWTGFPRYLLRERSVRFALAGGVLLLAGLVALLLRAPDALVQAAFVAATLVALAPIARSGLSNLWINRDFNINLLMTIAAGGALLIGETAEAATVIFLFAIGEALEGYAADRARDSLRGLVALAPARATRLRPGQADETVLVERLALDDVILVPPGERIAMDSVVLSGESGVDQAPITGESVPAHKRPGDAVYAGTINGSGALTVRVTRLAEDNTLARIVRLVEEAQSVRAPSQRAIDRFARVYTPAVVVLAALVAFAPPLLTGAPLLDAPDGTHGWLYRALALLVIACPCALVISTPVTVITAITAAARRGVLIKGGAHLEALADVRTFAFDKTGTLTHGRPVVTETHAVDGGGEDRSACDDMLALASAVERRSAHPLARAVVGAAEGRGVGDVYAPAESVEMLAGRGVQGRVNGRLVTVGSHGLFDDQLPHSPELCRQVDDVEARGQTTMLLAEDERVRGYIAVADQPRESSADVVRALRALGARTVMLTGDNAAVARVIGEQVGVDDVRADLLPEDKVGAVRALLEDGPVAMVGDGVNDTPALAAATVGIAMGGAGSAQALEAADIALMADDLAQLPVALRLARFARRTIRQNIALSIGVKLLFVALAVFGLTSLWLAILADVGMLLLVTANGMRPLRFR